MHLCVNFVLQIHFINVKNQIFELSNSVSILFDYGIKLIHWLATEKVVDSFIVAYACVHWSIR